MLDYVYISLIVSLPESLLVLLLGFYLANVRNLNLHELLIIAATQALFSFTLMMVGIETGYASILQIVSLYLLVLIFSHIQYYKAIIPVLIGAFIQGGLQSILLPITSSLLKIEITTLQNDFRNAIICFIPVLFISALLFLFIRKTNYYVCDIND